VSRDTQREASSAAASSPHEQAPHEPAGAPDEQAAAETVDEVPAAETADEVPAASGEDPTKSPVPTFTEEMRLRAEECIRNHVIAAVGIGFIPLAFVDLVGVTAIELRMIGELADIYSFPFPNRLAAYKLILSLVANTGPLYLSRVLQSFLKVIPLLGAVAAAGTLSAVGGASVYAVGKVFQKHFESGGTFLGAEEHEIREYYRRKLAEANSAVSGYVSRGR
jgi:uncharacterized protein (DUF697 family)